MKHLKLATIAFLLASALVVFAACSDNSSPIDRNQESPSATHDNNNQNGGVAPVHSVPSLPQTPHPPPPTQAPPQSSIDARLVGTWHANMDLDLGDGWFNYDIFSVFNADGTGTELYISGQWQQEISFTWSASNGVGISIYLDNGATETYSWTYTIVGNTLTMILDGFDTPFIFTRHSNNPPSTQAPPPPTIDARLVGTWHTNMDLDIGYGLFNYDIFYIFNADGTGEELFISGQWQIDAPFSWTASNGVGVSSYTGTPDPFNWTYTIVGNTLTMIFDGLDTPFIFTRQ